MRLPIIESDSDGPNLTPIIDVVFLLLIFFLVATRFDQQERELPIKLVQASEARPLSMGPKELIVNVTKEGEFIVVGETIQEKQLEEFIEREAKNNPGTKVQIRADQDVKFSFPVAVMKACEINKLEYTITVTMQK